ncbi:MAG: hypothetical protein NZM10_02885 [Fimbriimonadales bacterium]|nr:hypothetical protein [Fimbriimonadales bacterium]
MTRIQDQASGLRTILAQRRQGTVPRAPLVYADVLVFPKVRAELPRGVLVWHWRARHTPAVGWDLQMRLHVVGSPTQFELAELQRWRTLFPEWRLVGARPELLHLADVVCLWLKGGTELIPRLQILLAWLSRNRPQMPIILAGIGSGAAQRLQNWVQHRYPLRCLTPAQELTGVPAQGYYRLLRWASAAHPSEARFA